MKNLLTAILVVACLVSSCQLLSGPVERLQVSQATAYADLSKALGELKSGSITKEEYETKIAAIKAEQTAETQAVKAQLVAIEKDIEDVAGGAIQVGTGEVVGGVGTMAAGLIALYLKTKKDAVVQVNNERDRKYVVHTPPPTV